MRLCLVCLISLQLSLLALNAQDSPTPKQSPTSGKVAKFPPARDGSHDFDFLIGDWKAHVRRLRSGWLVRRPGLSMTAFRITKSCSIPTPTLSSSKSTVRKRTFTSKRKRFACTTRSHINGVFIWSISTKGLSSCRRWLVSLTAIVASFTISNNGKAAQFSSVTFG